MLYGTLWGTLGKLSMALQVYLNLHEIQEASNEKIDLQTKGWPFQFEPRNCKGIT